MRQGIFHAEFILLADSRLRLSRYRARGDDDARIGDEGGAVADIGHHTAVKDITEAGAAGRLGFIAVIGGSRCVSDGLSLIFGVQPVVTNAGRQAPAVDFDLILRIDAERVHPLLQYQRHIRHIGEGVGEGAGPVALFRGVGHMAEVDTR